MRWEKESKKKTLKTDQETVVYAKSEKTYNHKAYDNL